MKFQNFLPGFWIHTKSHTHISTQFQRVLNFNHGGLGTNRITYGRYYVNNFTVILETRDQLVCRDDWPAAQARFRLTVLLFPGRIFLEHSAAPRHIDLEKKNNRRASKY